MPLQPKPIAGGMADVYSGNDMLQGGLYQDSVRTCRNRHERKTREFDHGCPRPDDRLISIVGPIAETLVEFESAHDLRMAHLLHWHCFLARRMRALRMRAGAFKHI
jgi:hypothetical protein